MSDEVLEAMKEEIELLDEFIKYLEEENSNEATRDLSKITLQHRLVTTRHCLSRIVSRVEKKTFYRLGVKDGKVRIIAE
jgi:hypothetical protein